MTRSQKLGCANAIKHLIHHFLFDTPGQQGKRKTRALLIGIEYKRTKDPLLGCHRDTEYLKDWLEEQARKAAYEKWMS